MKIKMPEMPSDNQLAEWARKWADRAGPCMIDHWPADLLALSMPTIFIDMPQDCMDLFEPKTFENIANPLAIEIDAKIGWNRKFYRLNSRSPKDIVERPVSCSGKEMIYTMAGSMRMLDDLCDFARAPIRPKLCLRDVWHGVQPYNEYRVFVKEGDVLAVAEYFNGNSPELPGFDLAEDPALRAEIDEYLKQTVFPRLHIKTVVVDITDHDGEWHLIEINPYGGSDPVGAQSYQAIEAGIPSIARLDRPQRTLVR